MLLALATGCGILTSCNEKDSSNYISPVNVAVTSFSLKADYKNPGLDSVYFTIDLKNGVIFNADSLRKGTNVSKVIPEITFSTNISEATIIMSGGEVLEGESDYRTNPNDSIDFTGDVWLRVKADNNEISKTYRIKVNVHRMATDSLFWNEMSFNGLSTRLQNPRSMKTVQVSGMPASLVEESDGSYSLVKYNSVENLDYSVNELQLPFIPAVETLSSSGEKVWILDRAGELWEGTPDFQTWTDTGEKWSAMIGVYQSTAIGLRETDSETVFSQYPALDINPTAIPDDFPTSGFSNFVTLENKWTSSPVAFFIGGITRSGSFSDCTWAFDGSEWIKLSSGGIPALEGASLIPYYHYRPSADGKSMIEYNVWLMLGGREADGTFNRDLYISYDNGVNWALGTTTLQLPEIIPSMVYCDNLVIDIEKSADLSAGWTEALSAKKKVNYWTDGDIINWECPYIYLFGGYSPENKLYTTIWRGVLGRLTFTPVI